MISDTELSPYIERFGRPYYRAGQTEDSLRSPFARSFYYRCFNGNEKTVVWVGGGGRTIGWIGENAEVIGCIGWGDLDKENDRRCGK